MAAYLDAHVHLWELADGEDFWMRDKIDGLHRDFTAADLARLQDACGVGGAIVVQAMHNHRESERERWRREKADEERREREERDRKEAERKKRAKSGNP